LIQEENEDGEEMDASFHSVTTEMYNSIVPHSAPIVASQISPTVNRPRIVKRMVVTDPQDTVLSFTKYTTDPIVNIHPQKRKPNEKQRLDQIKSMLRVPSIALNPFQTGQQQKELGFFNKNRLFENSHHQQVLR
jgi:hypothetical protein